MHSLKVGIFNGGAAAPLDAPRGAVHPVAHAGAQPELELASLPLHQQNDLLPCAQHRQILRISCLSQLIDPCVSHLQINSKLSRKEPCSDIVGASNNWQVIFRDKNDDEEDLS